MAGNTDIAPQFITDKATPIYIVFGDHTRSFNIATESFCVMDNVKVLKPKKHYSTSVLLYIISSWQKCIPNKGYCRHWSMAKDVQFYLPITKNGQIDYGFMKKFISELQIEQVSALETAQIVEAEAYLLAAGLKDYVLTEEEQNILDNFENLKWGIFNLEKLFEKSTRGKRLKSADRFDGALPFVTAGETDEGISAYIGNCVDVFPEKTITIDMFGSAKYRNYCYGADDHVAVIHTDQLPKLAGIFATAAIHKSSHNGQFDYSKNFYAKDADNLNVFLPAKNNLPDYSAMEVFISAIQKLVIKDVISHNNSKIAATKKVIIK